ncbi:MAG: sulfatase-like hydrolase/transferase [Candidatus Lokiarchaeota archaeon]|nr:sulfatase-like hydrolase/transferase [Candidatus Lokiarchaeota archaeon]
MKKINRCILVTIDCWRFDRLKVFGNNKNIMPNLDNITKESVIFKNMISNSSNTAPSFYAIFMSKIPVIDGDYTPLPKDKESLPKIIEGEGIKTCGIHSNPHLGRITHYNEGFDEFYDLFENHNSKSLRKSVIRSIYHFFEILELEKIILYTQKFIWKLIRNLFRKTITSDKKFKSPYANAETVASKAINWLSKNYKQSFFLWLHFMDAHRPYFPPDEFIGKVAELSISDKKKKFLHKWGNNFKPFLDLPKDFNKEYEVLTESLYNAELNYIDYNLGLLKSFLKKKKIYEQCSLILTADHGEALFEHDNLGHQISLYDELLRIPFILKLPNFKSKFKSQIIFDELVESIDIAPTILELLKIPKHKSFNGQNLLKLIKSDDFNEKDFIFSALLHNKNNVYSFIRKKDVPYYVMISCRTKKWKLIFDEELNHYELFNLLEDPSESTNLYHVQKPDLNLIKELLKNLIRKEIESYNSETKKISRIISLHKINGR